MLGFLAGFLVAMKPRGGGGILRNSDTLPFVTGMGLLFVTIVTQFCGRMDRRREDSCSCATPELTGEIKHLKIRNILSVMAGIAGIALMVMSFLRTFRIMPR